MTQSKKEEKSNDASMRLVCDPDRPPIIGTFGALNFGDLNIEYANDDAAAGMTTFADELWVRVLCFAAAYPQHEPLDMPAHRTNARSQEGVYKRVAGLPVTVQDFVPREDCQEVLTQFPNANNAFTALDSVKRSFAVPFATDCGHYLADHSENAVENLKLNGRPLRDMRDDDVALNHTIIGQRYGAASLMHSFREIASLCLVCRGFHSVLKEFLPQIRLFRSKRDRFTLQENGDRFADAVLSREYEEPPPVLDTVWLNNTNYTKLMLIRKKPYAFESGAPTFVVEVLPMWLYKRAIEGIDIELSLSSKLNSQAETTEFVKKAERVYGRNCATRQLYDGIVPCPINGRHNINRLNTRLHGLKTSRGMYVRPVESLGATYERMKNVMVCGMYIVDPAYLCSISWQTNAPSWSRVPRVSDKTEASAAAAAPRVGAKRPRDRTKPAYANFLLPQRMQCKVYLHGLKDPIELKDRPFYAITRKRNFKRHWCTESGRGNDDDDDGGGRV